MSRLFDNYFFSEQYTEDEYIRRRKEEEEWQRWSEEKANELVEEPAQRFVLQDGEIIEG